MPAVQEFTSVYLAPLFYPYASTFVDKETPMCHLLATLRVHLATRTVALTMFCDACGEVCTPACRHEALRDQTQRRAQEIGLYHR